MWEEFWLVWLHSYSTEAPSHGAALVICSVWGQSRFRSIPGLGQGQKGPNVAWSPGAAAWLPLLHIQRAKWPAGINGTARTAGPVLHHALIPEQRGKTWRTCYLGITPLRQNHTFSSVTETPNCPLIPERWLTATQLQEVELHTLDSLLTLLHCQLVKVCVVLFLPGSFHTLLNVNVIKAGKLMNSY